MPPLDVVVGSVGLLVDAPVIWKEHCGFNPLSSDIGDEVLQGLSLGFNLQVKEQRADLLVGRNGKALISVNCCVACDFLTFCDLLHMQSRAINQIHLDSNHNSL